MVDLATAANLIEHLGVAGLTLVLWYLERKERIKLQGRLDDCLEHKGHRR